jgi:hypothetical protein
MLLPVGTVAATGVVAGAGIRGGEGLRASLHCSARGLVSPVLLELVSAVLLINCLSSGAGGGRLLQRAALEGVWRIPC